MRYSLKDDAAVRFYGVLRRYNAHSSMRSPEGKVQYPSSPAAVFTLSILPPTARQCWDAGLASCDVDVSRGEGEGEDRQPESSRESKIGKKVLI